jgi:hypothetical protein
MLTGKPWPYEKADVDFDDHVRKAMDWHFDPQTGAPFWLGKRAELEFDPIRDVHGAADLVRFPDISAELRTIQAQDLIPRGLAHKVFRVYDSGGTTGSPKRIVDSGYRSRLLVWAKKRLIECGVPVSGNWLFVGPTGPHVVGFDTAQYAALGHGLFYSVDLDPRWVKRLIGAGKRTELKEYIQHLLDQTKTVLQTQDVNVLSTTPPLLEAICGQRDLYDLVRSKVAAIIWSGTSFSPESLRQATEQFFPEISIVGVYGNSLMGVAPQRPRLAGDEYDCIFEPFKQTAKLDLVDEYGGLVEYGQRGRVRLHLVSEEMLFPNVLERDTAIRVKPMSPGEPDGLADVQTYTSVGDVEIIEGVY